MFCHVIWHKTFNNTAVRNQYLDIIVLHHSLVICEEHIRYKTG